MIRLLTTDEIKPGRVYVVNDGAIVVENGHLAHLQAVDSGDPEIVEVYINPADAEAFKARWFECNGRLN